MNNLAKENFFNPMLLTIHNRKSVRKFTDEKISKKILELLIKAGMAAPSAVNIQPWAFIAIDDEEILKKLHNTLPYAKMLKNAAIVVCGDNSKSSPHYANKYWVQDCSAATENILLAVESLGLGAVWTAVFPVEDRMKCMIEILNLLDHITPLNVIPIGYPASESDSMDKWKPDNLHWNKW
ncbi:MAG: nitroreductase family protein [Candidatus Marinimicrobia bacterium]|nr:nitroreductase family protein [Candidatus Neomarinimicrobiota bacterium]